MQKTRLKFYGYTWERYKSQIEHIKGVVVVYRGKLDHEGSVSLLEIVFVFYGRLTDSAIIDVIERIKRELAREEMLFYSIAECEEEIAETVTQLLVNIISPRYNSKTKAEVNNIMLECIGKCELMPKIVQ